MGYIRNLAVAVDQLGNAISGGNADATISARVGYNAVNGPVEQRSSWRFLEDTIDWAFEPIDGPEHCQQAVRGDNEKYRAGSLASRLTIAFMVGATAPFIGILLRLAKIDPIPGPPKPPTGVVK